MKLHRTVITTFIRYTYTVYCTVLIQQSQQQIPPSISQAPKIPPISHFPLKLLSVQHSTKSPEFTFSP